MITDVNSCENVCSLLLLCVELGREKIVEGISVVIKDKSYSLK